MVLARIWTEKRKSEAEISCAPNKAELEAYSQALMQELNFRLLRDNDAEDNVLWVQDIALTEYSPARPKSSGFKNKILLFAAYIKDLLMRIFKKR